MHKKMSEAEEKLYREMQQLIFTCLEKMVSNNSLPKVVAVADEVGMGESEFRNKVSMNQRTPLTWGERLAIENIIAVRDPQVFQDYLRVFHLGSFKG